MIERGGDTAVVVPHTDPEIEEILALRSRNRERVLRVLRDDNDLPAGLVAHVIPLLAWDAVAEDAVRALRKDVSLSRAADLAEQAARIMLADLDEWRLVNQQRDLSVG